MYPPFLKKKYHPFIAYGLFLAGSQGGSCLKQSLGGKQCTTWTGTDEERTGRFAIPGGGNQ